MEDSRSNKRRDFTTDLGDGPHHAGPDVPLVRRRRAEVLGRPPERRQRPADREVPLHRVHPLWRGEDDVAGGGPQTHHTCVVPNRAVYSVAPGLEQKRVPLRRELSCRDPCQASVIDTLDIRTRGTCCGKNARLSLTGWGGRRSGTPHHTGPHRFVASGDVVGWQRAKSGRHLPWFGGSCPPFVANASLILAWMFVSVGLKTATDSGQFGGFGCDPNGRTAAPAPAAISVAMASTILGG